MLQILPKILPYFSKLRMQKTNNNIVGYHLVSRRVISTSLDVQRVYRCPQKDLYIT